MKDIFYLWVMKYCSNIEIISPQNVRTEFQEKLKEVMEKI